MMTQCASSYGAHLSRFLRVNGTTGWTEMSPAFSYSGLKLRGSTLVDGREVTMEPSIKEVDQFTREIDHMSACILSGTQPHTGGPEGLQDMKLIAAIYRAAETGRAVALEPPPGPTRGPEPRSI
jgi:predicted dehydrogenase